MAEVVPIHELSLYTEKKQQPHLTEPVNDITQGEISNKGRALKHQMQTTASPEEDISLKFKCPPSNS